MLLKKRIPKDFYKLFRTKNRESYMQFLVKLYEENNEVYAALGLTMEECRVFIADVIEKSQIIWEEDEEETDEQEIFARSDSPTSILNRLICWGWLKSDFDEKLNTEIIAFPEYSQLYTELFKKLQSEDNSRERESMLSIYSALFTYHSDSEKNNQILKNALTSSKGLGQLLSNMQDGMRAYFDELSSKKDFIGIQEVLVEEINNNDSKKYTILTTTDSFYRYKEAVKELISQILGDNDRRRDELELVGADMQENSILKRRNELGKEQCQETNELVIQVEREFDLIERKYNKLIEQKSIFAQRALARIHYILQEGTNDEDNFIKLINLLDRSSKKDEIMEDLQKSMTFTTQYRIVSDNSFYIPRNRGDNEFRPVPIEETPNETQDMTSFVPKPLYTKKQLQSFYDKNIKDGVFRATEETVQSVEDLEKLLFIWQDATGDRLGEDKVSLGEDISGQEGFTFSQLQIEK